MMCYTALSLSVQYKSLKLTRDLFDETRKPHLMFNTSVVDRKSETSVNLPQDRDDILRLALRNSGGVARPFPSAFSLQRAKK